MSHILQQALPEHLSARQSAKRREWSVQVAGVVVALVCVVLASLLVRPINRIRREQQLIVDPETIKGLPPDIQLLGKLGTFRALVIDWASIRAERLKEEGKTYEALELHLIVCKLAPRFAKVWTYASWNMAYNISVMQYTPEARWKWVKNGIELLRDQAIVYNPKSVTLYKELAWTYWHKVGGYMDDEHLNYKKALAVEMERVLGAPPVVLTDKEYFDWFRRIVDAPRDLATLPTTDNKVAALIAQLDSVGIKPDDSLLDIVARNLRPEIKIDDLVADPKDKDPLLVRRLQIITDPDRSEALGRLLAAVRSDVLRRRYKFDLDFMMELMTSYGPLDWRNGFTHALYWSSLGDKVSRGHAVSDRADKMNTARFIFFSLQSLISRGKIILWPNFDEPFDSYIALTPDTTFIPYLFETYMKLGKEHFGDHPKFREGTPGPNYMTGLVTNMHNWIELLFFEGGEKNLEKARNFYAWLREFNLHPNGSTQERYLVPLQQFVLGNTTELIYSYKAINGMVRSLIDQSIKRFSVGQINAGVSTLKRARVVYETWMKDTKVDFNDRRKMQAFKIILRDQIEVYIRSSQIAPLFKATLWKALPLEPRQLVYDRLTPYFERVCAEQTPPWALDRAFTEPAGMAEFRNKEVKVRGERQEEREQGSLHKQ